MATTDEKIISLGVLSYNNDKMKGYIQEEIDKIPSSIVDDTLSDTSEHPVQNKVVNAALNSKADQTTVDSALAQKANSADVTASLAGKSDTGHTHDDRYYTESEINTLLGDKVGVSDFNSHTNNTTVHVTSEEKAAWDSKAEMSDIPTSLPANGGNSTYVQGYAPKDSGKRGIPTLTSDYGPLEIGKYLDFHTEDGQDYKARITANDDGTISFSGSNDAANSLINSLNVADGVPQDDDYYICQTTGGGESDTTYYRRPTSLLWKYIKNKLGSSEFYHPISMFTDADECTENGVYSCAEGAANVPVNCFGILTVSTNIYKMWWVQNFTNINNPRQYYVRTNVNGTYTAWTKVSDGGNAASVGAYTEAKIAALEARIAALENGEGTT